jgi:hypothetical protein
MPIRINLLAEARIAEEMRRRDPVKRSIIGGAFLVALALVWSSSLQLGKMLANKDLAGVQGEIQTRTNEFKQVMMDTSKMAETRGRLDDLQKLSDSRFLQGNLLNALQQATVPGVQLSRLRVEQTYLQTAGTPPGKRAGNAPKRSPTTTEKIMVLLEAKDFSANPGDQVNKFKDAIARHPYFQTMLDKTNGLRLANLSAPQPGADGKTYVLFTVECRLPELTR